MSVLDIDKNIDTIDLGIIRNQLIEYMRYYYGKTVMGRDTILNRIKAGKFDLKSDIDIYPDIADDLIFYHEDNDISTIYIIRDRLVFRRNMRLIYAPIALYPQIRLLTLKNVMDFTYIKYNH